MSHHVWVELGAGGLPIRILRNKKDATTGFYREWPRRDAVSVIRHQIFLRSKGDCEFCASPITEQGGHLHEQVPRGKGGEISLANSIFICATCHRLAHADRNPRFTKKDLTTE